MSYCWIIVKLLALSGRGYEMKRTDEVQDKYDLTKLDIQNYGSTKDYILHHYLEYGKFLSFEDNKFYSFRMTDSLDYGFSKNKFPYNVDDNIGHYLLWSIENLENNDKKIKELIDEFVGDKHYVYFYNPPEQRSIPDLFHVQIFVKEK